MLTYYYNSPVGTFYIKLNVNTEKYDLLINDECYGSDYEPNSLANNVSCKSSGYDKWDSRKTNDYTPTDVYQWNQVTA